MTVFFKSCLTMLQQCKQMLYALQYVFGLYVKCINRSAADFSKVPALEHSLSVCSS